MTISLENAQVYDIETLPNVFTFDAEFLNSEQRSTWEISQYRDDREQLFAYFDWLYRTQTPMIGFNNVHFDYPVIHWLWQNRNASVYEIHAKSQEIINGSYTNRFAHVIWDRDRFAPQIDLFKIYHFDNKAKSTSLKYLQINMRSPTVVESRLPFDENVSAPDVEAELIPYNIHDVKETKRFAHLSKSAIDFRLGLIPQHGVEVLNWNDTKIGENILIQKIGENVCFDRSSGRKTKRQTVRTSVSLNEIIFPYVTFQNPEFKRVLQYMRDQVLTPDEIYSETGETVLGDKIKTKGAFVGLKAHVNGLDYHFGTGGIHASVPAQHVKAEGDYIIRDIDVASLYPSIAIANGLYPEHLGQAFVEAYASLPKERKEWQKKKGKKCAEANSLKLAANGAYGKSNDAFSVLLDARFTMAITINGQLSLAMLAEWLSVVPTLQIIQANTDGITYRIHREYEARAVFLEDSWQRLTGLVLEHVYYSDMWIRDVNNYVAKDIDGNLKQKGAYWHPDPNNYFDSISAAQPPAWHKDLGNQASVKAALAYMMHGIDPELFLRTHSNPFDFMCQIKVKRSDILMLGAREIQRTTRYYVAQQGETMMKIAPPAKGAIIGQYKKRNGVSDYDYQRIMSEIGPGAWDERIHTKNKSTHQNRETGIEAGYMVCECNDASTFRFDNINYAWYAAEARKLIIGS